MEEIDLSCFEKKVFSQNGEDGVLEKIFQEVGTTSKYFVEFGTGDGSECNTRYLREVKNWKGLLLDYKYENQLINLHQCLITAENICEIFEKHQVPNEFDLLSVDIDGNDFYVLKAILEKYRPRVIIAEYNSWFEIQDKIVPYHPYFKSDATNYWGVSITALYNLASKKGFSLVYAEDKGVNVFFVRNDVLNESLAHFKNTNRIEKIYRDPRYIYPVEYRVHNRPFVKSTDFL